MTELNQPKDLPTNVRPAEIVIQLALYIRDCVRPHLGELRSRRITGTATSGDTSFAIDYVAEEAIDKFVVANKLSIVYYSEDRGLVRYGDNPQGILVIDPIDGTRPAMAGFEQCVVAVSWSDYVDDPKMQDVRYSCVAELKQNAYFIAERGVGVSWYGEKGELRTPTLLLTKSLNRSPLSFEAAGRPLEYLGVCLSEVINTAALGGGCFMYNSTAYSLTRLITGQLAAVVDVGARLLYDFPWTRSRWVEIGNGTPMALFTYDIAAACLIAKESGAIFTDAYGRSLGSVSLLDTSESNLQTIVAASNTELHNELMDAINCGFKKFADQITPQSRN